MNIYIYLFSVDIQVLSRMHALKMLRAMIRWSERY